MAQTAEDLRYELARQHGEISRDLNAIGERVSPGKIAQRRTAAVKTRVHNMRDSVMGTAESVMGTAEGAAGSVTGAVSSAAGTVGEAPQAAKRQVEGAPLAAGLVSFGLGAIAAALLPPTAREEQLAKFAEPGVTGAVDTLKDAGREVVGELKEPAREAVEQVKETANMATTEVKDQAEASAHATTQAWPT